MKRSMKKLSAVPTNHNVTPIVIPTEDTPRTVTPSFDWHIIRVEKSPAVTSAGIVIPETLRVDEAIIAASGPGRMMDNGAGLYPMIHKPGDRFISAAQPKLYAMLDGKPVYAVRDCDILCVVNPREERKMVSLA